MSRELTEFVQACHHLDSDKNTERRKGAERLRELLQVDKVRDLIQESSPKLKRSSSLITWDGLFKSVQGYVYRESESILKLEKQRPNPTGSAATIRKGLKQDVADTVRAVLRASNSCGGTLNVSTILSHVTDILRNTKLQRWLAADYSHILLNHVFPYSHYTIEISLSLWTDLQNIYCQFYMSPLDLLDRSVISRIIHTILIQSSQQFDIIVPQWYQFFTTTLKPSINDCNPTILEHLLSTFNVYCFLVAPNARGRLCKVGEELVQPVLHAWIKSGPSVKEQILILLHSQIRLHHPDGASLEDKGAWSSDDHLWEQDLEKMYEFVLSELESSAKRLCRSSKGETGLSPALVNFAVDVMQQVFYLHGNKYTTHSVPQAKRPRLDFSWSILKESLSTHHLTSSSLLIVWLQVTAHTLSKLTTSFPQTELRPLLVELHDVQKQAKKPECCRWVFIAMRSLTHHRITDVEELWQNIWQCCLRTLQYKVAEEEGFTLLSAILDLKLFNTVDLEPWKLIVSTKPTRAVMSLLISLLRHHKLPENLQVSLPLPLPPNSVTLSSQYSYRTSLLVYLLGQVHNQRGDDTTESNSMRIPISQLSYLLVSLLQPLCSNSLSIALNNDNLEWITSEYKQALESFEQSWSLPELVYLKSSFEKHPLSNVPDMSKSSKVTAIRESVNDILCQYLCELLSGQCQLLLQPLDHEVQSTANTLSVTMQSAVCHSTLILQVLYLLESSGALSCKEQTSYQQIPSLLSQVTVGLKDPLWSDVDKTLYQRTVRGVLKCLINFLEWSKMKEISKLFKECFPLDLLQEIIVISTGKYDHYTRSISVTSSTFSFNGSNSTAIAGNIKDGSDDIDLMEDSGPSNDSDISSSTFPQHNMDILNPTLLNDKAFVQQDACHFLVLWYSAQLDTDNLVWTALKNLLTEDSDLSPRIVQLFVSILSDFVSYSTSLPQDILNILLSSLRKVLSRHHKNYFIHKKALVLLNHFVPLVTWNGDKTCWSLCLNILSAFWSLYCENNLRADVRCCLADSLDAVVRHDITGETLFLSRKRKKKDDDDNTISVRSALIRLLNDNDHSVRVHCAKIITVLFSNTLSGNEQLSNFDEVKKMLQKAYLVKSNLDPLSSEDESVNRVLSMLCTLQCIACVAKSCERHVISVLVCATGQGHVDGGLVKKVIDQVAIYLGYTSGIALMEEVLSFLITQWLIEGPIEDFPHQLFDIKDKGVFFKTYYNMIVPHLVDCCDNTSLDTISKLTTVTKADLIIDCLSTCMVFILTSFAEREGDDDSQKRCLLASQTHDFIISILSKDILDQTMKHCISQFVVELLCQLYEPSHTKSLVSKYFSSLDPEPPPPHYTSNTIRATLDYLPSCYFTGTNSSVITMLAKKKDILQTIFLQLNLKIYSTHRLHERKRLFLSYSLFANLVCQEIKTGLNGLVPYIVMDIVSSISRLLQTHCHQDDVSQLFSPCCDTLTVLCKTALEDCPQILGPYCHVIVNTVLPFTLHDNTDHRKLAMHLLELLIQNGGDILQDYLILIDPLPNIPHVNSISKTLDTLKQSSLEEESSVDKEILRFCSMREQSSVTSIEGLTSLYAILHKSWLHVHQLAQQYDNNTITQLILTLLDIVKNTCNSDNHVAIATEVCRCLGELGYMELSHIAISSKKRSFAGDIFIQTQLVSTSQILELLSSYLSDKDIDVVHASSDSLRSILSTISGSNVLGKLQQNYPNLSWCLTLEPFKTTKKKKASSSNLVDDVSIPDFASVIDVPSLWQPSEDHSSWLTQLVLALLRSGGVSDEVLVLVEPVCRVKPEFCEHIFPIVIYDLLSNDNTAHYDILSKQVSNFFAIANSMIPAPVQSITIMLNMIMYLRTIDKSKKNNTSWENNFWLQLDFLQISKASLKCSSYFTSLLYLEIWYIDYMSTRNEEDCDDILTQHPLVQSMLLDVYCQIGEPDGSYGACILFSPENELTKRLYEHQNEWQELFCYYNYEATTINTTSPDPHLLKSVKNLGCFHIMKHYLKGFDTSDQFSSYQHEVAWRCCQWEDSNDILITGVTNDYNSCINTLLVAMKDGKYNLFNDTMTTARLSILHDLCETSSESVCNFYPHLTKMQTLLDIEYTAELVFHSDRCHLPLITEWEQRLPYMTNDFQFNELIMAVRISSLRSLLVHFKDDAIKCKELTSTLVNLLLIQSKLSREAGQYQIAKNAVVLLKEVLSQTSLSYIYLLEEAKLTWNQGRKSIALLLMKNLLKSLDNLESQSPEAHKIFPIVLRLYGNWLADTLSENPVVILEVYLEEAVRLLESQQCNNELLEAYLSLARFADSQYQRIASHMSTAMYKAKRDLIQQSKIDVEALHDVGHGNKAIQRHVRQLIKHSEEDESIMKQQEQDRKQFLEKAIVNYALCLKSGDQYNLRVFRLCSLWFANNCDLTINTLVKDYLTELPSYKFLPLIYQLAARMSSLNKDSFQTLLHEILYKLGHDHPYHTIYVFLALANAGLDNDFPNKGYVTGHVIKSGRRQTRSSLSTDTKHCTVDEEKVKAAIDILNKLKCVKPALLKDMMQLCECYIDLAYHDVEAFRTEKKPIKIPSSCPLLKLKPSQVAIPTLNLPVDPLCEYKSIITIQSYDGHLTLCGGINLPKVLSCLGSDGRRRRQLLKGRDDLRQDAVMQQVFSLVNQLLLKNPSTVKRKLSIRTYKVIPLSQCSGIVEWCVGTIPLGTYLIGSNENPFEGAHCRYRPKDWKNLECRKKFAMAKSKHQKSLIYKEICRHFKPVFSHFFMEYFTDPGLWYERRLAYTRCMAASSIVGYIMGLGDRHVQNILIDKQTAELIHIDLGVAFEQGRTLPTPEVIPFRLTRDLVNGMGLTGVEGVFQRCCEETLAVMRASQEELKTIVEVLVYDPLYIWTLSPRKVRHIQRRMPDEDLTLETRPSEGTEFHTASSGSQSNNKMAERVLIRLQEKLEGLEDGVHLSVNGQVTHLIQEATDSVNLSLLFHGWQPWL